MFQIKEVDVIETENPYDGTRVYFWPEGKNVIDNLMRRFNRTCEAYQPLLEEVFSQAEIDKPQTINWSQRAGCSCGCSPGFVAVGLEGFDIHVTVVVARRCPVSSAPCEDYRESCLDGYCWLKC